MTIPFWIIAIRTIVDYKDIRTVAVWTKNFLTLYSSIWSVLRLFEPFNNNLFIYLELSRSGSASKRPTLVNAKIAFSDQIKFQT